MKQQFDITGMTCSACSAHVEKAVSKVNGVKKVAVNLLANNMLVNYDEKITNPDAIIKAVVQAGYDATLKGGEKTPSKSVKKNTSGVTLSILITSAVICLVLMYVGMGHMVKLPLPSFLNGAENAVSFAFIQLLLCLPVWYINRSYFINGFKRLFKGAPNMDSLIAVGSFAGGLYGIIVIFIMSYALGKSDMATVEQYHHQLYFESSAMILALVDLGKYLEGRSKIKTGDALAKLKKLAPDKALKLVDGNETEVDSKSVKVDDIVIVKAGMVFPADGHIVSGSSFVNESSVNGESLPVEKQVGDFVIGGTVSVSGYVQVKVSSVGSDSILEQIISLVEEAGASKAPIQRLADKISAVFVPVVMSIALVTFIVWMCVGKPFSTALDFAISVLVISCPCALGLATPVAIMVATGKGAEHGILIKDGETLEKLADIKKVVLDKTGTLTLGKPHIKEFKTVMDEKEFLSIVGGIEKQSEHPLGKAVVEKAEQLQIELTTPASFETLSGRGVLAVVNGKTYAIGNSRLMKEQQVDENSYSDDLNSLSSKALTCLIVAENGKYIGIICVGDEIKPTSYEAIQNLKNLGIEPILLTGDNAMSAKAVCKEVGIENFFAEVLPSQKEEKIAELMKDGACAMVGDGINDAPALTRADVGFAVANGSDIAVDSADVLLMKNDIRDVAYAIELSRKTKRNIKQNLFWAFFYNSLGIPLAAGVLFATPLALKLNPMIAAAAMSVSSLFVVLNALRLRLFKPRGKRKAAVNSDVCQSNCKLLQEEKTEINKQSENNKKENETMKYQLQIEGMMCGHCVSRVTKALSGVDGVTEVNVSLEENNATVTADSSVSAETLKNAVEQQDYKVTEVKTL